MALKTFNVDADVYAQFSKHCKGKGMSMSKQVENFLRGEIEKITKMDSADDIDVKRISKDMKNFDKAIEHPLSKYC